MLMFGWEFPPFSEGGLGTACYGLTKGLSLNNVSVLFVMPHASGSQHDFLKIVSLDDYKHIKVMRIDSPITPYMTSERYKKEVSRHAHAKGKHRLYGANLIQEIKRYGKLGRIIASEESFDIIHAHDWMTYRAGIAAKKISKKPLVVHVHATEFDRTGGLNVNQRVYSIERQGMHQSDAVIAVSQYTKDMIVRHYGIKPEKVNILHNAVEINGDEIDEDFPIKKHHKVVLFLGRITLQKGPDYFLFAAKKVLEQDPNVRFVIVGSGDMEGFLVEKAVELGISDKVFFAGYLRGEDVDRAYQMANLYVMPSVSEPFGITALEAISNKIPVIVSKQSGVSEVVRNCLKVDFWDIDEMVNKILAVLNYPGLDESLKEDAFEEVKRLTWKKQARKCVGIYNKVIGRQNG